MSGVTSKDALYPLCVDLDGTLVSTDTLAELLLLVIRRYPLYICQIPFWLARGKSVCKRELAIRFPLDAEFLPYNQEVVSFLHAARESGQKILLVTGANQLVADRIAKHLGLFDEVIASQHSCNLVGRRKLAEMEKRFGVSRFDYVGNSSADLPVWGKARRVFVVASASSFASFKHHLQKEGVEIASHVSRMRSVSPRMMGKALRIYEWGRNLPFFIPILLAHRFAGTSAITKAILGFFSFSLMASAVHLMSDLLCIDEDRRHTGKRFTPFASGGLSIWSGLFLGPLLTGIALAISLFLPIAFWFAFIVFAITTAVYSRCFKWTAVIGVIIRACLYLLPLAAGSILAGIELSNWMLGLLLLFFLISAAAERVLFPSV